MKEREEIEKGENQATVLMLRIRQLLVTTGDL
jgi:hypothetical protein